MPSSSVAVVNPRGYVDQLNVVRGLACLTVMLGHVVQVINYGPVHGGRLAMCSYDLITNAFNAEGAVLLFFVLSGCVLAISLRSVAGFNSRILLGFYVKRLFRLYPLLWFATLVAMVSVLGAHALAGRGVFVPWLTRNLESPVTLPHTLLSFAGIWTEYDGPIWSLRVELIYSGLFPLIFVLVRNPRIRGWFITALLVLACLPFGHPQYGAAYGASFAIGALIPLLPRQAAKPRALFAVVALIVLCYDRSLLSFLHPPDAVYNVMETIASFVVVRHVFVSGGGFRFLSIRPLARIGDLSFSVYLLHLPILLIVFAVAQRFTGLTPILHHPVTTQALLGLATCILTIALSSLTFTYIEAPLHQIGRRLGARLAIGHAAQSLADDSLAIPGTPAR